MAERRVSRTRKDSDGDITHVCHPGADWSPRASSLVISDIENSRYRYYVINSKGGRTYIEVVDGPTRKYLRTRKDETPCDNLDELPDC